MTFTIRESTEGDAAAIVRLLGAHWTEEGWSLGKFSHYYRDYPDGEPLAVIAVEDDVVVAHVGLLPVRVAAIEARLVLQVLVSPTHRRGSTLVELIRFAEEACRRRGARFLCGFGNRRFTKVAARFLGWRVPGYLRFGDVPAIDLSAYRARFHFQYGATWHRWKFGADQAVYVKPYDKDGQVLHQLLKTRDFPEVRADAFGVSTLNLWHPDRTLVTETQDWIQPFVFMPLVDDLPSELFDLRNWYVEMGDSDTFEPYKPWAQGSPPSYARKI